MQNPSGLTISTTFVTITAANAQQDTTLLAAPAAGERYRVWALMIGHSRAGAVGVGHGRLYVGVPGSYLAAGQFGPEGSLVADFPGGVAITAATLLGCRLECTEAEQLVVVVGYTQETA